MQRFSSVALVDPRGWVLMQERDEHPELDPETWGLPGGHVEDGETFVEAGYRELEEETGVAWPGELYLVGVFDVRHGQREDQVALYAARTTLTDADVECREGRRMVFVDPATLPDRPVSQGARVALPHLWDSPVYDRARGSRGARR